MNRFIIAALVSLAAMSLPAAQAGEPLAIDQSGTDEVTIAFQHDGQTTYFRRHIDRSLWQFKTCAAQMAAWPSGNAASVWQNGAGNSAAIAQRGRGGVALTTQNGNSNAGFSTQTGAHDFSSVSQRGMNWTASVNQSGVCDIAIAGQMNAAMFTPLGVFGGRAAQYAPPRPLQNRWATEFASRSFARQ